MTEPAPAEVVRGFLDAHATLTLACTDAEGPWAADVYFVRSGTSLYFFSSPASRHSRAFAESPHAAGTVHGVYEGWEEIRGVQMSGAVTPAPGVAERIRITALYLAKFPFARGFFGTPGKSPEGKISLYEFTPIRVLWVDNSRGFGHRNPVSW